MSNKRRQQPSLPTDPSDPCEDDDLLAESARERLESFFGHLGQEDVGDIRPSEPEWQPSRSVSEWAGLIWASVPPALRWWVTEVERQDPLSPQRRCLPMLRALVAAWAEKDLPSAERFAYIKLLFESQRCPEEHLCFLESRESVFAAFPTAFGRSEYKWDDTTAPIEQVLSIVDCFVTLCEDGDIPGMLEWDPITRITDPVNFKAGGVHEPEVVKRWEAMPGCAKRVVSWVKNKVFIKPVRKVKKIRKRNAPCLRAEDPRFDAEKAAFVAKKFGEDRKAGVIKRLGPDNPPHATCPISVVPKAEGSKDKYRIIGSMIALNKFFPGWRMRFEDLRHFSSIFSDEDWLFNLDLKAAYHTILTHPWLARLLGFYWDGAYWHWTCLPFGFRLSPYVFCRVVKQVVKLWRRAGISVLSYVDDQAGAGNSFVAAIRTRNRMLRDNEFYGFSLASKSAPLPMQRIVFLGFVHHLACPTPKLHVPTPKVEALEALAKDSIESIAAEASYSQITAGLRRIVDVCCGKCCMAIALWLLFPTSTWILAIDLLPDHDGPGGFWEGIPEEVWPYITYICVDVIEMSIERIEREVRSAWGCGLSGVAYMHWSHMCDSLSRASNRGPTRGMHRYPDFSPKSDLAINHDERFHFFLRVLREFVRRVPLACVSVENPLSPAFLAFADLHQLASEPGWRLIERADHCVMANHFDVEPVPNKPSTWLVYGLPAEVEFPICDRSCRYRVHPASRLHRRLVCPRKGMHPRQSVIESKGEKSRIPFGAAQFIFGWHLVWLRSSVAESLADDARRLPMRKVAKIVGRLIAMGLAVSPARLMCNDLMRVMYSNERVDWEAWVRTDPAAAAELLWIARHLSEWNRRGLPIWKTQQVVDVVLTQDASPTGVGFRLDFGDGSPAHEQHIPFAWREAGLHHVHREMLGLVFAVLVSKHRLTDRAIQIRVDSTSTVKYVRDRGGASEVMTYLTKKLWGLFIRHRVSLASVSHLAGVEMVRSGVDGLSRPAPARALSERDRAEWQLTPNCWSWVVDTLRRQGIELSCDRFASRANRLCERFCSLQLEPGALTPPNCLAHDWSKEKGWNWAFPPLTVISKVLQLVVQQQARAVVLVPEWRMHWYTTAMRVATSVVPITGPGPFFRRLRDGQWQEVEKFVFRPLLLVVDASGSGGGADRTE